MNKILTIVIPSYNTEKYVDECLPTMLSIEEKEFLEILIINDGSTDGTLKKIKRYEEKFSNIVRVIHKENGGHGSVINRGIQEATGKYFKVVDGDDWVNSNNLNFLIKKLKMIDVDLVINSYQKFNEVSSKESLVNYGIPVNRINDFHTIAHCMDKIALHSITYKTSILKINNIRVREKCFYEDTEYVLYPLTYVKTAIYYDFPVYIYRVGSATQSVNAKQAFKNRQMHEWVVEDCIAYYNEHSKSMKAEVKDLYSRIVTSRVMTQYNIYLKNNMSKEHLQEIVDWDLKLKQISGFYYAKSNVTYIYFLRKNIKLNAKILGVLYSVIMKVRRY